MNRMEVFALDTCIGKQTCFLAAGNQSSTKGAAQSGPLHVVLVNNSDEQAGTQGVHPCIFRRLLVAVSKGITVILAPTAICSASTEHHPCTTGHRCQCTL